jgi:hypothetical protein
MLISRIDGQEMAFAQHLLNLAALATGQANRRTGAHGRHEVQFVLAVRQITRGIPAGEAFGLKRDRVQRVFERQKSPAKRDGGNACDGGHVCDIRRLIIECSVKVLKVWRLQPEMFARIDEMKRGDMAMLEGPEQRKIGGGGAGLARAKHAHWQQVRGNHDQAAHRGFSRADNGQRTRIKQPRQGREHTAIDKANRLHQRHDDDEQRSAIAGDGELPVHEVFRSGVG